MTRCFDILSQAEAPAHSSAPQVSKELSTGQILLKHHHIRQKSSSWGVGEATQQTEGSSQPTSLPTEWSSQKTLICNKEALASPATLETFEKKQLCSCFITQCQRPHLPNNASYATRVSLHHRLEKLLEQGHASPRALPSSHSTHQSTTEELTPSWTPLPPPTASSQALAGSPGRTGTMPGPAGAG